MKDELLKKILVKAIEFQENGKKTEEILAMFPEAKSELQEMFEMENMLEQEKNSINPSRDLFEKIVTENKDIRYKNMDSDEGRSSSLIINLIEKLMNSKLKIAFSAIIIVLLVGFVFYHFSFKKTYYAENQKDTSQQNTENNVQKNAKTVKAEFPKATGNADQTVDAIIASITAEQAITDAEFNDALSISADNSEINNFFQTYDENSL